MADTADNRQEVLARFPYIEEDLVTEYIKLCQMYNKNVEDVFWVWEALTFGSPTSRLFTKESIEALRAKLQADLTKANTANKRANLMGRMSRRLAGAQSKPNGMAGMTRNIAKPAVPRQDGFDIPLRHSGYTAVAGPSKVTFTGPKPDAELRKERTYRYMYEKVSERSEALDDRIEDFAALVAEHYNVGEAGLGDPSAITEEDVTVVGRITFDYETSAQGAKLNEASIVLESSRQMGSGFRIPLKFDPQIKVRQGRQGVGGFGLFPGAIVACRGKNGGGGCFLATEILALPPVAPQTHTRFEGDSSFSMYIASGPYTADRDLNYEAWQKLLTKLKTEKPAVTLLLGPFVHSEHSLIQNGEIDVMPEDLFTQHFIAPMQEYLDSAPGCIVLIVPSVKDLLSSHAVYPQGMFSRELSNDPRIRLLPNPCKFSLNGVSFGVSSIDVLFHLRKEELFKRAEEVESTPASGDVDSMANLCRHIVHQRSFYPIFPVPHDLSHEVNLDVTHWKHLNLCGDGPTPEPTPDVIITPSKLKQFSKNIDGTVFINPSFSTKGTCAILSFDGNGNGTIASDKLTVEVIKLE